MRPLGTPASAGSTSSRAMPTGLTSDHPRVGGDQASTLAAGHMQHPKIRHEALEGVITA